MTSKPSLRKLLPDAFIGDPLDVARHLGWDVGPTENGSNALKCCGEPVYIGGWIGQNYACCHKCGKGMTDLRGPLPASAHSATVLDADAYAEFERATPLWCDVNYWGPSAPESRS